MRFCKICKTIYRDNQAVCPECRKKTAEITDINEPVKLCVVGGTERALLRGLLSDAGIPFVESNARPEGVANTIVTGFDVKLNNACFTVPFQALPNANELMNDIESVAGSLDSMIPEIEAWIRHLKSVSEEEKSSMSPALRTTVKVISAIVFLVLVAVVVLGTDKIMELIKGLFGG